MKFMVVDDEHLARTRMHDLIQRISPDAAIIDASNGEEAIEQYGRHLPELALIDIRMPGIGGIELAYHLSATDSPPAIIFTTAHNEYALQAFDANAIDYLLKPIQKERLERAITKALPLTPSQNDVLKAGEESRSHISVREKGKLKLVQLSKIGFFRAENKYVVAKTKDAEYLLNETLNQLEEEIGEGFIRAHRNALVSTRYISGIEKTEKDHWVVFFDEFEEKLEISRRQKPVIRNWLRNKNR